MSWGFFLVGAVIFAVYVALLFWIIFSQHKKQREEGNGTMGYYERHQPDSLDYDGMSDQGRIPNVPRAKAPKRKKGSQSRAKDYSRKFKTENNVR